MSLLSWCANVFFCRDRMASSIIERPVWPRDIKDVTELDTAPPGCLPPKCAMACSSAPIAGAANIIETWLSDEGGAVDALTYPHKETMLMLASAHGHEKIVELCLVRGANVNLEAADGYTALHRAVMYARTRIVRLLIRNNGDVTAISHAGHNSVLSELCHGGSTDPPPSGNGLPGQPLPAAVRDVEHVNLIKVLVDAKASIDHRDHQGITPLMHAASKGRTSIVRAMLAVGANRGLKDDEKRTAYDWAYGRGYTEAASILRSLQITCAACRKLLSRAAFSNSQLKKPEGAARCKHCASTGAAVQTGAAAVEQQEAVETKCSSRIIGVDDACAVAKPLACAGCGALPAPGRKMAFKSCGACAELQLASPALYCGRACQRTHWRAEHKAWHDAQAKFKARLDGAASQASPVDRINARLEDLQLLAWQASDSKYDQLIAQSQQLLNGGMYDKAARTCRKAISINDSDPRAFDVLGAVLAVCHDLVGSLEARLKAAERYEHGSAHWASCVAMAFQLLLFRGKEAGLATPSWWNDDALKELSAKVVDATQPLLQGNPRLGQGSPPVLLALSMRGWVLSGWWDFEAGSISRTAAELREAAACFQAAHDADPVADLECGHQYAAKAVDCLNRARWLTGKCE